MAPNRTSATLAIEANTGRRMAVSDSFIPESLPPRSGAGKQPPRPPCYLIPMAEAAPKKKTNYRNAWREAREVVWAYRGRLAVGMALMLVSRVAALVLPASSKVLIDRVLGRGEATAAGPPPPPPRPSPPPPLRVPPPPPRAPLARAPGGGGAGLLVPLAPAVGEGERHQQPG